jgi:hypothetical protein
VLSLSDKSNLNAAGERLSRAFRTATLTALQTAFLSVASLAEKTAATQALNQFHQAARRLRISENAFNKRARPAGNSLMNHMRNSAQFAAMRSFSDAKANLLAISPDVGRSIVRLVAQGADPVTSQRSQVSGPSAAL